jgi:hypothetical protein
MPGLLEGLIQSLIPFLVAEAEKIVGGNSGNTQDWIKAMVQELFALIQKYIPQFLQPEEAVVEKLIADALAKILPQA